MWYLLQEQYPIVQFNIPVSLSSLNAFYFCKHWHLRETFSKFPSFLVEMSFGVKSVSDDERGLDINVHISKHTSPKHTHRDLEMMCHNLSKNIGKYQIWGSICHILNIILSCFNLPFFTTSRITPFLLLVHDITTGARTGSHPKNSCTLSCRGIRV